MCYSCAHPKYINLPSNQEGVEPGHREEGGGLISTSHTDRQEGHHPDGVGTLGGWNAGYLGFEFGG